MLNNRSILFLLFLFLGVQFIVSQESYDSIKTNINVLSDQEIESWLDEYAIVEKDSINASDTIVVDEKSDFSTLVDKGEEARQKEKNELISKVMSSMSKKREENVSVPESKVIVVESEKKDTISRLNFDLESLPNNIFVISSDSLVSEIKELFLGVDFQEVVNPLFLDWVFGVDRDVSRSLSDEDTVVLGLRSNVREYIRSVAPELYTYHKSQLPSLAELKIDRLAQDNKEKLLLNLDSLNKIKASKLSVDLPKMSEWSKGAKFQVHVSQNYITSNWYKGGESNLAASLYAMGYFNYNNRKGLQWDNKVEWKLGLYGMVSDSLRWLRVNEDLLRLNSKLGYKAFKNFYYTAEWDFQTSLFNTYKSNTYVRTSGPFSPIRMNLSLGMDYKYKKKVSVFISPLSYKLIYVADMKTKDGVSESDNIAHQVGITDGTRQSNQLGALVRTDFDYDFIESIGMEVHFSFFGAYAGKIKGVEVGCELIGNFKINRFLSAKVSLYPRYDSTTIPADGGKPKLQFYELISLGFVIDYL